MIIRQILTGLWLCVGLCSVAWGAQEGGAALNRKVEQERNQLKQLQEEIRDKKKKAATVEQKTDSVLKTIQELDQRIVRQRKESQSANRKLREKDRELDEIGRQLDRVQSQLDERRHVVRKRLRLLYMEGRVGYLEVLLASHSETNFQRRFDYLSTIAKREHELLQSYRADLAHMQRLRQQRVEARNALLVHKQQLENKLTKIKKDKRSKAVILTSLKKKKTSYDRTIAELERSAKRMDALIKELEQRRKLAKSRATQQPGRLPSAGSLLWPANGKVVTFFGRQKHQTFDTYINRKGIEIRTSEGSAIRAVSSGTVVYADWLKGYGLVVILDHTNGLFSLYAHASKLLVKEGEAVKTGRVIGETGETGVTTESTLYFELRKGTEPVDPLIWLVKRP